MSLSLISVETPLPIYQHALSHGKLILKTYSLSIQGHNCHAIEHLIGYRNDVKEQHLSEYFNWAISLSTAPESNVFVKQGILASVAMIIKHGKREDLLPYANDLLAWVINDDIKQNAGTNVQKLVYKLVQRIGTIYLFRDSCFICGCAGLTFLPPRVAAWRYKRGSRSLAANLSAGDGTTSHLPETEENLEDENIEVPDEVEEVIDQLIQGLRSGDGVVR